jgi:hypothetical protein
MVFWLWWHTWHLSGASSNASYLAFSNYTNSNRDHRRSGQGQVHYTTKLLMAESGWVQTYVDAAVGFEHLDELVRRYEELGRERVPTCSGGDKLR